MISVDEALERVLSHFEPLEPEEVEVLEALDCVLAEDVYSDMDVPPFDNSAMDGYAVRAADTGGASRESPVELQVIGAVAAGHTTDLVVKPGTAIRIMTGALLPAGADAVVRFEDTGESREGRVEIFGQVVAGANVRLAGGDVRRGELVLSRGTTLRPQGIGVLASLGRTRIQVIRRPRVGIVATGDELVAIDEPLTPAKIRSSNEYSSAALVRRYGGIPIRLGIARDDPEDLKARICEGLAQKVDLFITSAGVSAGDYDVVRDVLAEEGKVHFWGVRMRPGKALAFGEIQGVSLLGLSGNPMAFLVAFEQFARPAILKMLGKAQLRHLTVEAVLEHDVDGSEWCDLRPAVVTKRGGEYYASVVGLRGFGVLASVVRANGLIIIPEGVRDKRVGEWVVVQMLDWPEDVA